MVMIYVFFLHFSRGEFTLLRHYNQLGVFINFGISYKIDLSETNNRNELEKKKVF